MKNKQEEKEKTGFQSTIIYILVWFLILSFPLNHELIDTGNEFNWTKIFKWWIGTIPFLIIFVIHNHVLIPKLFFKKKQFAYVAITVSIVIIFSTAEYYEFRYFERLRDNEALRMNLPLPPKPPQKSLIPRPVTTQIILLLFMLASNLLIVIRDRYYQEKRRLNELESMRLQDELKYLKTQVNPHFFMNMLNNIHGMVEVDVSIAQDMILELSKLMRYVLYEGKNPTVSFDKELSFIKSYMKLMRRRFPEDKVTIDFEVPEEYPKDILLPPLLFITFLENAFKHGISYRNTTIIRSSLYYREGNAVFECYNTKPDLKSRAEEKGGVGLENVRRRLHLLYGDDYELSINDEPSEYNVKLIIPCLK